MGQCPVAKGGRIESFAPVPIPELAGNVAAVKAGGFHVLALTKDGALYAFGRGRDGQLGPRQDGERRHACAGADRRGVVCRRHLA